MAARNARACLRIPAVVVVLHQLERHAGRIPAAALAQRDATLVDTARRLFYANGFGGTTIEAIARAARVSPKTIYARFGNKEGLFSECMRARSDIILAALRAPLVSGHDVRTVLTDFAIRLLGTTSSPEALLIQRLVIAESARFPELGTAFYEAGPKRGMTMLAAFFERATAAGYLRVPDSAAAAEMFAGALLGVPLKAALIARKRLSRAALEERAGGVVSLFLAAYAPVL